MPVPLIDTSKAIVRADLSGLAEGFIKDETIFVGLQIAPTIDREEQLGNYYRRAPKSGMAKKDDSRRAPGTRAKLGNTEMELVGYRCSQRARARQLPDEVRNRLTRVFDAESTFARDITYELMIELENEILIKGFDDTNLPADSVTGASKATWLDDAACPIVDYADEARDAIGSNCGHWKGNGSRKLIAVFPTEKLYSMACKCTQIREKVGASYNDMMNVSGRLDEAVMARQLSVDQVVVVRAQWLDGTTKAALGNANRLLFCVADATQDESGGTSLLRTNVCTTEAGLLRFKEWREEGVESTFYEGQQYLSVDQVFKEAGYMLRKQGT